MRVGRVLALFPGPSFVVVIVQYPTKNGRSLGKGLGVQLTDQRSITCNLKIGPLYPDPKNIGKCQIVLLLITAIPTVGFSISVIICCKCVAFQLVMGYKAQGLCACAFTKQPTENQSMYML